MRVVATFGIKYEPDWLVHELMQNLDWVDDFAIVDCRKRKELWIHEGEYRRLQRKEARAKKADWLLTTSPDERWEKDTWHIIGPMIEGHKDKIIFQFMLRELYTPRTYRTDGIWGTKKRPRLYPMLPYQKISNKRIQCSSYPLNWDYRIQDVDINIYHLKMIEPANRKSRAEIFNKLDPSRRYQKKEGYDYLDDETDAEFEKIPKGRGYTPKYRKYEFKWK